MGLQVRIWSFGSSSSVMPKGRVKLTKRHNKQNRASCLHRGIIILRKPKEPYIYIHIHTAYPGYYISCSSRHPRGSCAKRAGHELTLRMSLNRSWRVSASSKSRKVLPKRQGQMQMPGSKEKCEGRRLSREIG